MICLNTEDLQPMCKGMMDQYAEQFTPKERTQRVVLYLLLGVFIIISHQKWVFPFIAWYADTAHCHTPFGYDGFSVLWLSVLVGLPLFCALIIGVVTIPLGYRILRERRYPPAKFKVYKPTKIKRGYKATLMALLLFFVPLYLIGTATWGYYKAAEMPVAQQDKLDYSKCENPYDLLFAQ